MRWLRGFFKTEDPIVKLIGQLPQPEALMRKELLENNGIPAMVKDTSTGYAAYGAPSVFGHDIFVKQSDVERAEEVLGPLMEVGSDGEEAVEEGSNGHGDGYAR